MNDQLRSLFPVTERAIYLNHAAVSPPPLQTIQAVESQLRDVSQNGSLNYRSWLAVKQETRELLASMLGARPDQVAFMRNTSDSLSTVANGLAWSRGDNIVTYQQEFPSNIYPWLRLRDTLGVEVRFCQEQNNSVDLNELCELVDDRTRIVAISHVQFASGFRADLERLGQTARKHDALLVVDVIQSLGVIPLNVEAELVDVAAGACHKWLLCPEGLGYLYFSDRARERIQPTLVGWTSVPNPENYSDLNQGWNAGTLAWETGTGPTALLYGLRSSLKLLLEAGTDRIAAHLEALGDHLCERLRDSSYEVASSREPGEKSQIIRIRERSGREPLSLYNDLRQQNIITAPRGNGLRISPHLYNTLEDIERLISALS
jgi:selenocysteine lyase/cysteine desulfurase